MLTRITQHVAPGSLSTQQRANLNKLIQHLAPEPDHKSDVEMFDHGPRKPKPTALAVANSPNATLTSVATSTSSFQDLAPESNYDSDVEMFDHDPREPKPAALTVANSPNATPTSVATPTPPQHSVGGSASSTPVLAASTKTLQPWTQGILAMKALSLSSVIERFIESKPDNQALKAFLGEDRIDQELEKGKFLLRDILAFRGVHLMFTF